MDIIGKIHYAFSYISYILNADKKKELFDNYLSIVAIIKNETPYIKEWIEYHLITGVTKFYIFDNESEDNLKDVLQPYINKNIVEYYYIKGKQKQRYVYNKILKKARKETFWLAVIDCDEFIVPISTSTINEFLIEFENFPGVEINWVIYGSSGHKTKTDGLVIERFKSHSLLEFERNRVVKTIVNPRKAYKIHVHNSLYFGKNLSVNANKEKIIEYFFHRDGLFDKIRINHYYGKSYEEFLGKMRRGIASKKGFREISDFHKYDRNEIENDPIMDKYIPIIYEKLRKRKEENE